MSTRDKETERAIIWLEDQFQARWERFGKVHEDWYVADLPGMAHTLPLYGDEEVRYFVAPGNSPYTGLMISIKEG